MVSPQLMNRGSSAWFTPVTLANLKVTGKLPALSWVPLPALPLPRDRPQRQKFMIAT
jgi:hypothetical protein